MLLQIICIVEIEQTMKFNMLIQNKITIFPIMTKMNCIPFDLVVTRKHCYHSGKDAYNKNKFFWYNRYCVANNNNNNSNNSCIWFQNRNHMTLKYNNFIKCKW